MKQTFSTDLDLKAQFSERLKISLAKRSIPLSPTVIRKAFNQRYTGKPISVQTVSNWLSGVALPNQERLLVLAEWLSVDSHWLRFGAETQKPEFFELAEEQRMLIQNFALLSPKHQKIINELIISLIP